jgi:peptide/nickel transport system substrate-binding protein
MVHQGGLPPLDQRLPENPLVLYTEGTGRYGGTLRRAWFGPSDAWGLEKLCWTNLFRFDPDANIIADVAESYSISDDGTVLRIKLREGLKWSDGHPYTVDDIEFAFYDILTDKDLNPTPAPQFQNIEELRRIGDYEFELVHKTPAAMATMMHSMVRFYDPWTSFPKHYLQEFHASYRDKAELNAEAKDAGYAGWTEYILSKDIGGTQFKNAEAPHLGPWIPTTEPDSQVHVLERNPYYHAVDSEGNQLPYIDTVENLTVSDKEVLLLQITQGNIDFQGRSMSLGDVQVLKAGEAEGNYTTALIKTSMGAAVKMEMNLNSLEPFKRKFFQDVRVRRALSLAINREEINEINYFGLGTVRQLSFAPQSPSYSEEWENAYVEYDPERARALLDEFMGDEGSERDDDGYMIDPTTGEQFILYFDTFGGGFQSGAAADFELLQKYFGDIGVQVKIRQMERALFEQRADASELDTQFWPGSNGLRPDTAVDKWDGGYWPLWNDWHRSGGDTGEAPTDPGALAVMDVLDRLGEAFQEEERIALMREMADIYAENLYEIGWVGLTPIAMPVNNNLKNVPLDGLYAEEFSDVGGLLPYQWYFVE